jgi:hypothetical protein
MRTLGGCLSLALLSLAPQTAAAQVKSYQVKITCTGYVGSMNFGAGEPGCPIAGEAGTEVSTGCVSGDEGDLQREQEVWYSGHFDLKTDVFACDSKRLPDGTDAFCSTKITGSAKMTGEISIYADRDGLYATLEPQPGQGPATTSGDCDPELTAELAADYPDSAGLELEDYPAGPLRVGLYSDSENPSDPFAPGSCVLEVLKAVAACP